MTMKMTRVLLAALLLALTTTACGSSSVTGPDSDTVHGGSPYIGGSGG